MSDDVVTNDDLNVTACTIAGVAHDWRAYCYPQFNRPHTSWRCVWCHAVACGDYDEADPCFEPYHHAVAHRSRSGVIWPVGGERP